MFKLEEIHIEEFRGIKNLTLALNRSSFVICGPNGSGKSGVIDAIEFALTGGIKRLSGAGTQGVSVKRHGPHVDQSDNPNAALVRIRVFLEPLGISVTIERTIASPNNPAIEPCNEAVLDALRAIESRAEIGLSRRELLRFILVQPGDRAKQIQALLNLESIDVTARNLQAAHNKLKKASELSGVALEAARTRLLRHMELSNWNETEILTLVNDRRREYDIDELSRLTPSTRLSIGLPVDKNAARVNKRSALRDLKILLKEVRLVGESGAEGSAAIMSVLRELESDPSLKALMNERAFLISGIDRISGRNCPLCDVEWDSEEHIRDHLTKKLQQSTRAQKLEQNLLANGAALGQLVQKLAGLITPVRVVTSLEPGEYGADELLGEWAGGLQKLTESLGDMNWLLSAKERFDKEWLDVPEQLVDGLLDVQERVESWPDQDKQLNAYTFLVTAQDRWENCCDLDGNHRNALMRSRIATAAYEAYKTSAEEHLNAFYDEIVEDFNDFYRIINPDDEPEFQSKLTRKANSVEFDVDFYNRGMFPPGAYHSEGHQDGMGVCLYLALVKRLYGTRFTFALLDDVVMSIDSGHRRQFCELLKSKFADTQFVITTHDPLWARQMQSAQLVSSKSAKVFYKWSIDTGPMVATDNGAWNEISNEVDKGNIAAASAALRLHLEFLCTELADGLRAQVAFRADARYELGDLFPAVVSALIKYFGLAAAAANSWGRSEVANSIAAKRKAFGKLVNAANIEHWAVNTALHYNEWANFSPTEFIEVVRAHQKLQEAMRCRECGSPLRVLFELRPSSLKCDCGNLDFHLLKNRD